MPKPVRCEHGPVKRRRQKGPSQRHCLPGTFCISAPLFPSAPQRLPFEDDLDVRRLCCVRTPSPHLPLHAAHERLDWARASGCDLPTRPGSVVAAWWPVQPQTFLLHPISAIKKFGGMTAASVQMQVPAMQAAAHCASACAASGRNKHLHLTMVRCVGADANSKQHDRKASRSLGIKNNLHRCQCWRSCGARQHLAVRTVVASLKLVSCSDSIAACDLAYYVLPGMIAAWCSLSTSRACWTCARLSLTGSVVQVSLPQLVRTRLLS